MTTRELSSFHEKNVAKTLSGVRTSNSGATAFTKGDVIVKDCLIECKTKMQEVNAFSIQRDWLTTLEEERRGMGKDICALAFSYDSGKSSYFVIDQKTMLRLLTLLENENQ